MEPLNNMAMLIGYIVMVCAGLAAAGFLSAATLDYAIKHYRLFWRFSYFLMKRGWLFDDPKKRNDAGIERMAMEEATSPAPGESP